MTIKNKHISRRKKKETSRMLNVDSKGDEMIAYEIINLFAGAIRALNDGAIPIPKHWENYLISLLKPEGSRKPPSASVRRRKIALAKSVITKKIDAHNNIQRPFLKDATHAPDSKNLRREIVHVMGDAKLELIAENKQKRIDDEHRICCEEISSIQQRINSGEDPWVIIREKFSDKTMQVLMPHLLDGKPFKTPHKEIVLSEKDKALRWMSDGMNLHIHPVHRDFAISLEHQEDIAVVSTSAGKKNPETLS